LAFSFYNQAEAKKWKAVPLQIKKQEFFNWFLDLF
jgi:hypothetical protein